MTVRGGISALKTHAKKRPLLVKAWRLVRPGLRPASRRPLSETMAKHLRTLPAGADVKVVFGGHWSDNPGWLLLTQGDQDITTPIDLAESSVDMVFAEHVIEHVPFVGGVQFLEQSFRILKSGGACRIVCPMLDRLMTADLGDANGREYVRNSLLPHAAAEHALLTRLGLNGLNEDPVAFLFNNLYMCHGHRFIWTSALMIKVMGAIGFRSAQRVIAGEGSRPGDCIERRRRGIYLGNDWRDELGTPGIAVYDVESFVVEGVK